MDILTVQKKDAIKAYNEGNCSEKKLLSNLFGEDKFKRKEGKDIKTLQDACEALNIPVPEDFQSDTEDATAVNAYRKIIIICRAINGDWKPNWNNHSEWKYYPWFKEKSGFGLSVNGYGYPGATALVGSRLCYKSSELAVYAGEQFAELYRDMLTLN